MSAPAIVAHRGASADFPEHTLAAYQAAIDQGADGLECDVRMTRDGRLVCVHDRTIRRVSNGQLAVTSATVGQLDAFDYGPGHRLLTLERLLGLIHDASRPLALFVETKHPSRYGGLVERALITELHRHGMLDSRVRVMSFSSLALRRVNAVVPELTTVRLFSRLGPSLRGGTLPPWADVAGPGIGILRADPGYPERAREHGNPTYCWTVDEPVDIALCDRLGVDWLATNKPGATRRSLAGQQSDTVAETRREP